MHHYFSEVLNRLKSSTFAFRGKKKTISRKMIAKPDDQHHGVGIYNTKTAKKEKEEEKHDGLGLRSPEKKQNRMCCLPLVVVVVVVAKGRKDDSDA